MGSSRALREPAFFIGCVFLLSIPSTLSYPEDFTLTKDTSNVHIQQFRWSPYDTMKINFFLRTHSYSGQILVFEAKDPNNGATELELDMGVQSRGLRAQLKYLGNPAITTNEIKKTVSDGHDHNVTIQMTPNSIEIHLDDQMQKLTLPKQIEMEKLHEIVIYLGSTGSAEVPSVVGCITSLQIMTGESLHDTSPTSAFQASQQCDDLCVNRQCLSETGANADTCVNQFASALCDCFVSGGEGAYCKDVSTVTTLNGNNYISVTTSDDESTNALNQPVRLTARFKTKVGTQQLLIHGPQLSTTDGVYNFYMSVLVDASRVRLELSGLIGVAEVVAPSPLNDDEWHTVVVNISYNSRLITLALDKLDVKTIDLGDREPMFFRQEILFGGNKNAEVGAGFHGCLKDMYVDNESLLALLKAGNNKVHSSDSLSTSCDDLAAPNVAAPTQPLPPKPSKVVAVVPLKPTLTCKDIPPCEHGGKCSLNEYREPHCVCDDGYVGSHCQFAGLPKTCHMLFLRGERRSGQYRIDPDGAGPVPPALVTCHMDIFGKVWTIVQHNLANGTNVRTSPTSKPAQGDSTLVLTYRNMTTAGLQNLQNNSATCRQFVSYQCYRAPLKFHDGFTIFKSAKHPANFGQIGDQADSCPCARSGTCSTIAGAKQRCACDTDEKAVHTDEDYLNGNFAGITEITVLQHKQQDWGKLTLGPLECEGTGNQEKPVTIPGGTGAGVTLSQQWKGSQLSFEFKTSSKDGMVLSQSSPLGYVTQLYMRNGHSFELVLQGPNRTVDKYRIFSTTPINDSNWHWFSVEQAPGELHMRLDQTEDFHALKRKDFRFGGDRVELIIGGSQNSVPGFSGCIKLFILDDVPIALDQLVTKNLAPSWRSGCPDKCATNPCNNKADCVENYSENTYTCVCKNRWAHSGAHCDQDVNQLGSTLTFPNAKSSYAVMSLSTPSTPSMQPLSSHILLSYRTDKHKALLLYDHDENLNFVQVTVQSPNSVQLLLNYDHDIKNCTIVKPRGEFSNMEWNQVVIRYEADRTELYVNELMCHIEGGRLLSTTYINTWSTGVELETVFPPRLPVEPKTKLEHYNVLYLGGVPPQPQRSRRNTAIYYSQIPCLQGCLRGLSIGGELVELQSAHGRGGVTKTGCNTNGCDEGLTCNHGGHCTVDWEGQTAAKCDCSITSYSGTGCSQDNGLWFPGAAAMLFDANLAKYIISSMEQASPNYNGDAFGFAFSTNYQKENQRTLLAFLKFSSQITLQVYITHDSRVAVNLTLGSSNNPQARNESHVFGNNCTDAMRHFVHIQFTSNYVEASVDGIRVTLPTLPFSASTFDLQNILLASAQNGMAPPDYQDYVGCMSNAMLQVSGKSIEIFDAFNNEQSVMHPYVKLLSSSHDKLQTGQCAQYPLAEGPPTLAPVESYSAWEMPALSVRPYNRPHSADESADHSGIAIALGVVFTVIFLAILLYIVYLKCYHTGSHDTRRGVPAPQAAVEGKKLRPADEKNGNADEIVPLRRPPNLKTQQHHSEGRSSGTAPNDPESGQSRHSSPQYQPPVNEPGFRELEEDMQKTPPPERNAQIARLSEDFDI